MLRLTVHLSLLILFYFAQFDRIEACKPHFNLNNVGWESLGRERGNSLGWTKALTASNYNHTNFNNIGWAPLERCEIELIEPSGRTTRFE